MERFSSAEEFLEFYRDNLKSDSREIPFVYGNSESAKESLKKRDSWAVFGKLDSPIYQKSRWALDVWKSLDKFLEDPGTVNAYKNSIDVLSAATLYAVTRAESNGEVGTGSYEFHRAVLEAVDEERIFERDWIEDIEYVGSRRDTELQADQAIEKEISEIEQEIEQKKEEIDSKERQIEQKDREMEEVQEVIDLYDTVVANSELLTEVVRDMEIMRDRIEQLDQVDDALIRDMADINSRVEEAEENLDRQIDGLERQHTEQEEDIDQLENNIEEVSQRLGELEGRIEGVEQEKSNLGHIEGLFEDLKDQMESTKARAEATRDRSYSTERKLEKLDNKLEKLEEEIESESQSSSLWGSIRRILPGRDKPGSDQTTIDDWT